MDIYDSSYFSINKKMLCVLGLWPYDSRKQVMRMLWIIFVIILMMPHIVGLVVDFTDIDKVMQHLYILLILIAVFLKHLTLVLAEYKMKSVYNDIANNWLMITDEEERKILVEYSQRGRLLTIAYICLMSTCGAAFSLLPLVPEILNVIDPLPTPRSHVYILAGEFLVENRDDYFVMIYLWDAVSIVALIFICLAIDPMYTASVEHCCALYAIVTYRLSKLRRGGPNVSQDNSYGWVVHTIKLHQTVLSFTANINDSYSTCFFCLTIMNIVALPTVCVIMMISWNDPVNFFRFAMGFGALMLHVFVLFWPGQKLIDHSTRLFQDAYYNEWYETSERTKKILKICMLRCSRPSLITAGGLVVMNFPNYFQVVKTAVSYITVLASFR